MAADPDWSLFDTIDGDTPIIAVDDSPNGLRTPPRRNVRVIPSEEQYGHRSAACRNVGHLLAYREGFDTILALDYDCRPGDGWLAQHEAILGGKVFQVAAGSPQRWINTIPKTGAFARGFPYEERGEDQTVWLDGAEPGVVKLNMGVWDGVLDLNAADRLATEAPTVTGASGTVASQLMFPICGMNVAFAAELTPAYFFLPDVSVAGWPLSRHDDIWGGYILKRLMDRNGDYAAFGEPVVEHTRLSDQTRALRHEHYLHLMARNFYECVEEAVCYLHRAPYRDLFGEFVDRFGVALDHRRLPAHYKQAFRDLHRGMTQWVKAFS